MERPPATGCLVETSGPAVLLAEKPGDEGKTEACPCSPGFSITLQTESCSGNHSVIQVNKGGRKVSFQRMKCHF